MTATATSMKERTLESALLAAEAEARDPNVRRWLRFANVRPGDVVEIQALKVQFGNGGDRTYVAHASSTTEVLRLLDEAKQYKCPGIYFIANRVNPAVASRLGLDKWNPAPKGTSTTDRDIIARTIAFIDVDSERSSGTSATEAELAAAVALASEVHDWLAGVLGNTSALGYGASGNGRGIYIALDDLAEPDAAPRVKAILDGLAPRFKTARAKIDTSVNDAKRLVPAHGTMKRKGVAGNADRPHRMTMFTCADRVERIGVTELDQIIGALRAEVDAAGNAAIDKALGIKPLAKTSSAAPSSGIEPESPFARANAQDVTEVLSWLGQMEGDRPRCPGCGESDSGVAVVGNGMKCSHARCASKGVRDGFRTPVDVVAEVRGVSPKEAVTLMAERFNFEGFRTRTEPVAPKVEVAPTAPPRLSETFAASLERAERRSDGREKPIALPWPVLADHFGGGLWPGLHFINKGTGVGGTQFALQVATCAAKADVPALYVGLELGQLDLALRMLGEEARVPWSSLWTGQAGPAYIARVREAVPRLQDLPFHYEVARPHGFAASALLTSVEGMRAQYPEADGPGSRPMLVVVDFLQLFGDEPDDRQDLRVRIGQASYVLRDVANRLGVVVLCISSVARERYKLLSEIHSVGELAWELDEDECPVNRRIGNTDAIVGTGKESGELEYSADSVSVIAKVPETWDGTGCDVVFATAKGRATGAMWSPMRFTGFRYEECSDRGGRMLEAWAEAGLRRERKREEKKTAKEQGKADQITKDAEIIRSYVAANPGCSVTEARISTVNNTSRRWTPAVALLGGALIQTPTKTPTGKQVSLTLAARRGG